MSKSKSIHLAADLSHYHTDYLWMLPGSWRGYSYYSGPEFYEDIARTAARGVMDMLFFGDTGGTPEDYGRYLRGEIERWKKVIEFSGAKAE